jgi:hypothetical protein
MRLRRIHRRGIRASRGKRNRRDVNARTAFAATAFRFHCRRFAGVNGSILNVHAMACLRAARRAAGGDPRYRAAALHDAYFRHTAAPHPFLRGLAQRYAEHLLQMVEKTGGELAHLHLVGAGISERAF